MLLMLLLVLQGGVWEPEAVPGGLQSKQEGICVVCNHLSIWSEGPLHGPEGFLVVVSGMILSEWSFAFMPFKWPDTQLKI